MTVGYAVTRLRATLRKYWHHEVGCPAGEYQPEAPPVPLDWYPHASKPCTCGLDEALDALAALAEEAT
jgi:hypothetical protein